MRWQDLAACGQLVARGVHTIAESDAIFFDNGRPTGAQSICATCPVSLECGAAAERNLEPWGVWAGEQGAHRRGRLGIGLAGELIERAA